MPQESALKPRKMHYFKIVSSVFRALWWFPFLHFGWRARDERRRLCWADVGLASDPETDSEYLVWESERGSKIRTGQDGGHHRAFEAKAHTSNNKSRCPVGFYKAVRSYRSEAMLDAPFHHFTNHQRKVCTSTTLQHSKMSSQSNKSSLKQFLPERILTSSKAAHSTSTFSVQSKIARLNKIRSNWLYKRKVHRSEHSPLR